MRKIVFGLVLVLLVACFAVIVSAQEATVEVPVTVGATTEATDVVTNSPTIPVTAGATVAATVAPTIAATVQATVNPPVEATAEVTVDVTNEVTVAPTMQPTEEMTAEPTAEVTPEIIEPVMTMPATDASGYLRIAQFAPDAPTLDVSLNGNVTFRGMKYPSITRWIALDPGTYTVTVSNGVFTPLDVTVSSGVWQTVAIVGSANSGTLQGATITEDYSDLLPSTGGFTFFNALEGSQPVNLIRDDVVFFAQIAYPSPDGTQSSSSVPVDAGVFTVSAVAGDDPSTVYAAPRALELPENGYTLVALIGTLDDARLFSVTTDRSAVQMVRGLLPAPGTIMEALRADDNLTAFAAALDKAGLSEMLSGSAEYTIFAPANFVMDNMDAMNSADLATALRSYIVPGKYTSNEIVDAGTLIAVDNTPLTITTDDNSIFVNGVQVIDVNIPAVNGVIHMLNNSFGGQGG